MNSWKGWQIIFWGIFLVITAIHGVLLVIAVIGSEMFILRAIIWAVAVIAGYHFLIVLYRFTHEKVKKACGATVGHKWNGSGCKCIICAAENHEWEYLKEISFRAARGDIRQHNHRCKKCGKVMRSRK